MHGIAGVEFSSYIMLNNKKIKLHILGYGFDENNIKMLNLLQEMKEKRVAAHIKLLNFAKMKLLNLPEESLSRINMERYCWFDREFIKCLEQDNYSMDVINYYRDYFKNNRFSYGPDYDLEVQRCYT